MCPIRLRAHLALQRSRRPIRLRAHRVLHRAPACILAARVRSSSLACYRRRATAQLFLRARRSALEFCRCPIRLCARRMCRAPTFPRAPWIKFPFFFRVSTSGAG